jgi:hypothetical protein
MSNSFPRQSPMELIECEYVEMIDLVRMKSPIHKIAFKSQTAWVPFAEIFLDDSR